MPRRPEFEISIPFAWTTDPHLNHVPVTQWERWIQQNQQIELGGLLITGDISEGEDVVFQLVRLSETIDKPIYFVLGNHDYYHSSIRVTRQRVMELTREREQLCYLTDTAPIEIAEGTFLIGEDGWGDATVGDYDSSTVRLNDFALIDEFRLTDPQGWKEKLVMLGEESAARLEQKLAILPERTKSVVVLTHVPPFRESCWYQGKTTDDNWAPFFVCGQTGRVLRDFANEATQTKIHVFCGHTHHEGIARMTKNLTVITGAAEYGTPQVNGLIRVDNSNVSWDEAW